MIYEALNLTVLKTVSVPTGRVLDIGCGTGNLGAALKKQGAKEVVGITYSPEEGVAAGRKIDRVLVADLDIFVPPPDLGMFDVIVCSHVLEHLREPHRLLRLMHQHIAPTGVLIVALPNILHWQRRLRFLFGDFTYTDGGLMDTTHLRFYTWATAQALIKESMYDLCEARADGHFPLPLLRRYLPVKLTAWLDQVSTRLIPGLFGSQFILLCRRRRTYPLIPV